MTKKAAPQKGSITFELPKRYDASAAEKKWQTYWEKKRIFTFDEKSDAPVFSVDTPPPTVSGKMHIGHAFSYAHQDFVIRYHRMTGKNVFYPWGFDDNGLATERFVEKKCGVRATDMSRKEFRELCLRETVDAERELKENWQALGISPDWQMFYRTIDDWCISTSQRSFIEIYKMGREYRKEAPTIWCPECQTAIAQVELEDREFESTFNNVVFGLEGGSGLVIATTRPELLPACVTIFVHPEDKRYSHLVGKMAKVPLFGYEVPILEDERADPEKGTGVVMCCTFGDQTDMEWWKAHNLPLRIAITPDGKMSKVAGKYAGMGLKEAREAIIKDLEKADLLRGQRPIRHKVNVHERCGTAIEFLVTKQWFIRYLDLKEKFIEAGRKIKWHPQHMRSRYENWIQGLQWDWCISRQRYSGVPFPVWYCKKCDEPILAREEQLPVDPLVDKPMDPCPKCGGKEVVPERDILDTWATSSLTPQIALKWKKDEKFFKRMYPMSLRPQAHDIITFWLFNTVVKGLFHSNDIPWKHVMISGWALDPHGKKMSKSKGNTIEPLEMIHKYSADCLRYWAASSKLGADLPFQEKEFVAGKKFITKLWNASRFVIGHLGDYNYRKIELSPVDRWLLSKLHRLIRDNTAAFESFKYSRVKADTENFFWHVLCDHYLELVKDRLYSKDAYTKEEYESALMTLYSGLLDSLKMLAPILPHVTEEIYHLYFSAIEKKPSIHVSLWPQVVEEYIDEEAEATGDLLVEIVSAVRKYKSSRSISLRTELDSIAVLCSKEDRLRLESVQKDLRAVTKAKTLTFIKKKLKEMILIREDVSIAIA